MTNRSFEQVSALLDDAIADTREQAQQLDTLLSDNEAQQVWARYALYGRVLKGEATAQAPADISAMVAARIRQEAKPSQVVQGRFGKQRMARWLRPAGSVAIAASVALVAVLTVQQSQPVTPEQSVEPAFATNPLGGRSPVSYNTVLQQNAPSEAERAQQLRVLQSYMLDHSQQLQLSLQAQQLNEQSEAETEAAAPQKDDN
ncbi:sigma-E factor negative regulatory protein [Pseudidiomarina salilacus]|uniref:sigma-E factor negative regulatory protein n=1 Tax=Pseudidiomarina salilacus TaxID=3384452 RepID=UPI0039854BEE